MARQRRNRSCTSRYALADIEQSHPRSCATGVGCPTIRTAPRRGCRAARPDQRVEGRNAFERVSCTPGDSVGNLPRGPGIGRSLPQQGKPAPAVLLFQVAAQQLPRTAEWAEVYTSPSRIECAIPAAALATSPRMWNCGSTTVRLGCNGPARPIPATLFEATRHARSATVGGMRRLATGSRSFCALSVHSATDRSASGVR